MHHLTTSWEGGGGGGGIHFTACLTHGVSPFIRAPGPPPPPPVGTHSTALIWRRSDSIEVDNYDACLESTLTFLEIY